jgi:hypothetical protein
MGLIFLVHGVDFHLVYQVCFSRWVLSAVFIMFNLGHIKLYTAIAVPAITYGSDIWTITKKQDARIETAEMKFLRKDQIRNTETREDLNAKC